LSKFFYKVKQEDEKIGFFGENSKNEDNKSKKAIRLLFLAMALKGSFVYYPDAGPLH
jgi:hypothetical protein